MPYKDPQKKIESMRRWRKEVMPKGYGRWLYARRKLRFDDAERFREAIETSVVFLKSIAWPTKTPSQKEVVDGVVALLEKALRESQEAEEALGDFKPEEAEDASMA